MEQGIRQGRRGRGEIRDKKERQEGEARPWHGEERGLGLPRSRAQDAPNPPPCTRPWRQTVAPDTQEHLLAALRELQNKVQRTEETSLEKLSFLCFFALFKIKEVYHGSLLGA